MDQDKGIIEFLGYHPSQAPALLKPGELTDAENLQAVTGALALRPGLSRVAELALPYWPSLFFDFPDGRLSDVVDDPADRLSQLMEDDDPGNDDLLIDTTTWPGPVEFICEFDRETIPRTKAFTLLCTATVWPGGETYTSFARYADLWLHAYLYNAATDVTTPVTLLDTTTGLPVDVTNASLWSNGVFEAEVELPVDMQGTADTNIGFYIYGPGAGSCGDLSRYEEAYAPLGGKGNLNEIIRERQQVAPDLVTLGLIDLDTQYSIAQYKAYINEIAPRFVDGTYAGGASVPTCFTTSHANACTDAAELAAKALLLDVVYLDHAKWTHLSHTAYKAESAGLVIVNYPFVPAQWTAEKDAVKARWGTFTSPIGWPYMGVAFECTWTGVFRMAFVRIVFDPGSLKWNTAVLATRNHRIQWWLSPYYLHWGGSAAYHYPQGSIPGLPNYVPSGTDYQAAKLSAWAKASYLSDDSLIDADLVAAAEMLDYADSLATPDGDWPTADTDDFAVTIGQQCYSDSPYRIGTPKGFATVEWDYEFTEYEED